jgi:hypothetical protein
MTEDEIIEMGLKAGLCDKEGRDDNSITITDHMERFANLVADKEREACGEVAIKAAEKAIDVAIELEREACAKVCEEESERWAVPVTSDDYRLMWAECATAIRARGQA